MKTILKTNEKQKEFIPFTIEIKVETIEEARLMFHIANCYNIRRSLIMDPTYRLESNNAIAKKIGGTLWDQIMKEVEKQGFEYR